MYRIVIELAQRDASHTVDVSVMRDHLVGTQRYARAFIKAEHVAVTLDDEGMVWGLAKCLREYLEAVPPALPLEF